MTPVAYMDKMEELREEIRQLRALAFGEEIQVPPSLGLTRMEATLLRCLLAAEVCSLERFVGAVQAWKHDFDSDLSFKVVASKLRRKLAQRGVTLNTWSGMGYALALEDRHRLRAECVPVARRAAA